MKPVTNELLIYRTVIESILVKLFDSLLEKIKHYRNDTNFSIEIRTLLAHLYEESAIVEQYSKHYYLEEANAIIPENHSVIAEFYSNLELKSHNIDNCQVHVSLDSNGSLYFWTRRDEMPKHIHVLI